MPPSAYPRSRRLCHRHRDLHDLRRPASHRGGPARLAGNGRIAGDDLRARLFFRLAGAGRRHRRPRAQAHAERRARRVRHRQRACRPGAELWLAGGGARGARLVAPASSCPAAMAFATAMHSPAERGKAIALVYAGMTLATVVGVPAGTLVASLANWRATFLGVGALSAVAAVGVARRSCRGWTASRRCGLAERLAVARRPDALKLLALTTLALIGPFAANTYLGVIAETTLGRRRAYALGRRPDDLGVFSFFGSQFGGYAADRWPRERYLAIVFVVLASRLQPAVGGPGARRRGGATRCRRAGDLGRVRLVVPDRRSRRGSYRSTQSCATVTLSLNTSALYWRRPGLAGRRRDGRTLVGDGRRGRRRIERIARARLAAGDSGAQPPPGSSVSGMEMAACLATED